MKTIFSLILTIGAAFIVDTFLAPLGGNVISPLTITTVCYWFWHLTLPRRLFLALGMGLLLDIVGFLPMGTYMLVLIAMAYICEPIKDFFSNNESGAVIALNILILMIIFRLLMSPVSLLNTFVASVV